MWVIGLLFVIVVRIDALAFGPSCVHLKCAVGTSIYNHSQSQQKWAKREKLKEQSADDGGCIVIFKHKPDTKGHFTIDRAEVEVNVFKADEHKLGGSDFDSCYAKNRGQEIACICHDRNNCHLDLDYWILHAYADQDHLLAVRNAYDLETLPSGYEGEFCLLWLHLWLCVVGGFILLLVAIVSVICCCCCREDGGSDRKNKKKRRKHSDRDTTTSTISTQ